MHQEALRRWYETQSLRLVGSPVKDEAILREFLDEWPTQYPPWTLRPEEYDSDRFGPLFAVSDEGSAAETIAAAAYGSAKARALDAPDAMSLGVVIDGERMTSAGEAPIGPDEYAQLIDAAFRRTMCSTNVGVRANARLYRLQPEFAVAEAVGNADAWLERVFAAFRPFLNTPNREPRPLTARLLVRPGEPFDGVNDLVAKLEAGRLLGRMGPAALHRLSLLMVFEREIRQGSDVEDITRLMGLASDCRLSEVAVDGEVIADARQHLSAQSLLNVLEVDVLDRLFREARQHGVRLAYRYQIDTESAARTIWTGLHCARTFGLTAGKYGLVPLTFAEQQRVIELITAWTKGWTAIPAFYVDTPLVTHDEVFGESRCVEAAEKWMTMVRSAGARIVLMDSPDRVRPRRLLRESQAKDDRGVLTLAQVLTIEGAANQLGLKVLWSGGITPKQAYDLAAAAVFGIFSTSSTATQVSVQAGLTGDPQLATEGEPTGLGVRRVHAAVQAGFLGARLSATAADVSQETKAGGKRLLDAISSQAGVEEALASLDEVLLRGWRRHWARGHADSRASTPGSAATLVPVPANAVRVWRGRRRKDLARDRFFDKLGAVFIPLTVQMQRLYGLTAYLPAVLPADKPDAAPDEIALVFYRSQQAYEDAKQYPGGAAYSDLHGLVFDLPASGSGFPELFKDRFVLNRPYHLFSLPIDWKAGFASAYVGTRKPAVTPDNYRKAIEDAARPVQAAGHVDGAVLFASEDFVVFWQHAQQSTELLTRFSDVTDQVFAKDARPTVLAPDLTAPGVRLTITGGECFNMQFPVVT